MTEIERHYNVKTYFLNNEALREKMQEHDITGARIMANPGSQHEIIVSSKDGHSATALDSAIIAEFKLANGEDTVFMNFRERFGELSRDAKIVLIEYFLERLSQYKSRTILISTSDGMSKKTTNWLNETLDGKSIRDIAALSDDIRV